MPTITVELESPLTDCGSFDYATTYGTPGFLNTIGYLGDISRNDTPTYYIDRSSWLRFKLPLAAEDTIISAAIHFIVRSQIKNPGGLPWDLSVTLYGNNVDNAANPTTRAEAIDQVTIDATTATVDWTIPTASSGTSVTTPDLKDILDEIKARPGWAADNYINILHVTNREVPLYITQNLGQHFFDKYTFDNLGGTYGSESWFLEENLPHLVIEYEEGVPGPASDRQVVHDLVFEQFIHYYLNRVAVEHTLEFEQDIAYQHVQVRNVEHTLDITQIVHYMQTYERTVTSLIIPIQDIIGSRSRGFTVEHTLDIQQNIVGETEKYKTVQHTIVIEQDIDYTRTVYRTVESVLDIEQDISQSPKFRRLEHVVSIFQEITPNPELQGAISLVHILTFEQDITYNVVYSREVEHELVIVQEFLPYTFGPTGVGGTGGLYGEPVPTAGGGYDVPTYVPVSPGIRFDTTYHPQATPIVSFPTEPVIAEAAPMTLFCPSLSLTLTMPIPLYGNKEEIVLTRVQRRTRGGTLKTFRDPDWPKVRTFRYKFDSLTTTKIEEIFVFFAQTLGLEIELTDYEGREWVGYIVNPAGEASQFFRVCGRTSEFDFEGVPA